MKSCGDNGASFWRAVVTHKQVALTEVKRTSKLISCEEENHCQVKRLDNSNQGPGITHSLIVNSALPKKHKYTQSHNFGNTA